MGTDTEHPPHGCCVEDSDTGCEGPALRPLAMRLLWVALSLFLIGTTLCTLAAFAGRSWWVFELICHFRVQLLVLSGLMAIVAACWRRWAWFGVAAVTAALNLAVVGPDLLSSTPPSKTGQVFKALLINVRTSNREFDRTVSLARDEQPDFIVAIETDDAWLKSLQQGLPEHRHIESLTRNDNFGVSLLSRHPIETSRCPGFGLLALPAIDATLSLDGQSLTILGTHTIPPKRAEYTACRNQQLDEFAAEVKGKTTPVMMLGDLNISPWSPYFGDLLIDSGLRDSRDGFGLQTSWPTMHPLLSIPIDHVLVSNEIVVHSRRIGPDVGSDHYPVIVEFSFREPGKAPHLAKKVANDPG